MWHWQVPLSASARSVATRLPARWVLRVGPGPPAGPAGPGGSADRRRCGSFKLSFTGASSPREPELECSGQGGRGAARSYAPCQWRRRGENLSPGGPLSGDGPHPGTRAPPARGRVRDHCVTTGTSNIEANKSDSASDLRNHHAIVHPAARLYDCVMVTQITLQVNPEPLSHRDPTGSIPAGQGHSHGKVSRFRPGGLIRSPWPGVVGQHPLAFLTSRCVRARLASLE